MSTPNYAFPFDPSGTLASNKIQGERQVISAPNWTDFFFIVPLAGPFFRAGHRVVHHPSGRILVEGVDYLLSHRFHDASLACGKPIYGSITFFDKTLTGAAELEYQTLGGAWTITQQQITEILSNKTYNPVVTTWEQVVERPFDFPIVDHEWDLVDMVGASALEAKLGEIREAILLSGEGGLGDHLSDYNNPHQTTKVHVGLGSVANFAVATVPEAQAGTVNDKYMTPLRTSQAITALVLTPLNNHLSDFANPHQTTKDQVGLDLVQNYQVASQVEAETGTSNTRYMTPLRTVQAMGAVLAPVTAHLNNTSNPHNTNKAQVGLGLVQNYGIADAVTARAGTANDVYMTPLMTREAIAAQSGGDLVEHVNNFNNPHNVTASHVGLGNVPNYAAATQTDAQAGTSNSLFMTPLRTAQAIAALATQPLTDHLNNTSNPHQTTAAQVGLGNVGNYPLASTAQAQAGTSDATYMTPLKVAQAIAALADPDGQQASIAAHLADLANPHGVTAAQVGLGDVVNQPLASQAEAVAGLLNTRYMTPLRTAQLIEAGVVTTVNAHIARTDNPHGVTAAQIGTYTTAQTDALLLGKLSSGATAVNSDRLGGFTALELVEQASIRYTYPPVNTREVDSGGGVMVNVNEGTTWSQLGVYNIPTFDDTNPPRDFVFYATGGERRGADISPYYRVQLSIRDLIKMQVEQVAGAVSDLTFGYVYDVANAEIRLYSRNPTHRNSLTLLVASEAGSGIFSSGGDAMDEEPDDIVYAQHFDYDGGSPTDDAQPGELFFGRNPIMTAEYEPGQSVEFINVVETPSDVTVAQAEVNPLKTDYRNFLTGSASHHRNRNAVLSDLTGWRWSDEDSLEQVQATSSLTSLRSATHHTDYTFEVELASPANDNGSIGVCAAFVSQGGKDYGIYVLRSPGGLCQESETGEMDGGDIYKLFTVGYQLLQSDVIDLGSRSLGLMWGDGVVDAGRSAADYVTAGGAGWDVAGACRVRVTRVGDTITIATTDFGSTDFGVHPPVVIDLTSRPELARFRGPTSHGFVTYNQEQARFVAIARPDAFVPYVHMTQDAEGRDTSTFHRYSGAGWVSQPMALSSSFIKPGRLFVSDVNGRVYFARRDGTLRPLYIDVFAQEDTTLLTP